MTRAVIELANEIDFAMSKLSKAIAGAAYNPKGKEMAFRIRISERLLGSHRGPADDYRGSSFIETEDWARRIRKEKAKGEIMRQLNRIYLKKLRTFLKNQTKE